MSIIKVTFIDEREKIYQVPIKWCENWNLYKDHKNMMGDEFNPTDKIPLLNNYYNDYNFMDLILEWYDNVENIKGETVMPKMKNDEIEFEKVTVYPYEIYPFKEKENIDYDKIEYPEELAKYRLKKYCEDYLWCQDTDGQTELKTDNYTQNWLKNIIKDKEAFSGFINFVTYLGCKVPLCICACYMNVIVNNIKKEGHGLETIKDVINFDTNVWSNNLPEIEEEGVVAMDED